MAYTYIPGDFILTEGKNFNAILIRIMTRSSWNHAALIINKNGDIAQVYPKGIQIGNIKDFKDKKKFIVHIKLSKEERGHVIAYADYMLLHHAKYDFFPFLTITLRILLRSRIVLKVDRSVTCSEFVALALSQGGIIFPKDSSLITPADLFTYFQENNRQLERKFQSWYG